MTATQSPVFEAEEMTMKRERMWILRLVLSGAFVLPLAAGCGGGGPSLSSVEGTVTLDGQPLANAVISFEPADAAGERSSYEGQTDATGHYVLHATASEKGAQPGDYTVHITLPELAADDPTAKTAPKLPAKYNTQSELKATVKDGKNTFDWPLTSS